MRLVAIMLGLIVFIGCKKEETVITIDEFKDRYLVCDSVITTTNGVQSRGTGLDAKFDSAKTYTLYSSRSLPPQVTYLYRIRGARIYYWLKGTDTHQGDYLVIKSKSGNHLVLEHEDIPADTFITYFYTAD